MATLAFSYSFFFSSAISHPERGFPSLASFAFPLLVNFPRKIQIPIAQIWVSRKNPLWVPFISAHHFPPYVDSSILSFGFSLFDRWFCSLVSLIDSLLYFWKFSSTFTLVIWNIIFDDRFRNKLELIQEGKWQVMEEGRRPREGACRCRTYLRRWGRKQRKTESLNWRSGNPLQHLVPCKIFHVS